jgi:tetratricopeptide (TPR) repeat protein
VEPAIACLYAPDEETGPRGTGFAISPDLALTAFHCIGNRSSGEIQFTKVRFQFRNDIALEAEYIAGNPKADFALLRFSTPLPSDLRPIGLASGVIERSQYRAIGFPVGYGGENGPDRFTVQGTVTDSKARFNDGSPALQLLCLESLAELSLHGLSGAPVLVATRQGESAIGLVRWNRPRDSDDRFATGATMFACPIATIIEQVPDIRPLVHEISPIAELATFPFPKAKDVDGYDLLRVALSEQVDRFRTQGKRPPYVPRAKDAELDAALRRSFFVLITGPSKAGKTRAAYELLLRNLPESAVVNPLKPESIRELIKQLEVLSDRPASLVLWLDDIERFLFTGRLTVIDLNQLSRIPGATIIGTLRNEAWQRLRQSTGENQERDSKSRPPTTEEISRAAREIFARATTVTLDDEMTADEKAAAQKLYPNLKFSKGLGESFIAGPELKALFDRSKNSIRSVVQAACDWARAGMLKPIEHDDLAALFETYYKEAEPLWDSSPQEFQDALREARQPIVRYSAMLIPMDLGDGKKRFSVPDYLWEYIETKRKLILNQTWELAFKRVNLPEQYGVLGWTARIRGVEGIAEKAYRKGRLLKDVLSTFNLAILLRDRSDINDAVSLFRECLALDPDYAEAHYNLACLIQKKSPRDAEKHYLRSIELKPSLAAAHNDYGLFLMQLNRKEEAFTEFLSAIHADPLLRHPHMNLLTLIRSQPVPIEILSLYQQLSLGFPSSAIIQGAYGYWLLQVNRPSEAEKPLRKAIELKTDFAEAYSWLGGLLAMTQKLEEAEVTLKTGLEYDPTDANAHYNLGYLYSCRGATDLGEHEYQEAIRHNPDSVEAWYNLGNILLERKECEQAEKCYRKAIRIKPDHLSAHQNLGTVLHLRGKLIDAKKEFCFVLNADPNSYRAHVGLGCVLRDGGDLVGAERELRTALEIAPDYRYAQETLARLPIEKRPIMATKEHKKRGK